ncbi:MAG: hypothetical protein KGY99_00585 [Phycisphaerae bacterium]|nr:hypothetical protein [Phycisphaerae bacterium]
MVEALWAATAASAAPLGGATSRPAVLGVDAVVGGLVVAAALIVMGALVLWSRRAIERAAASGFPSARTVVRTHRRER